MREGVRAAPALRIVVPVLDEADTLAARLHALAPLRARGVEVVVVDGGSLDPTWAIASELADGVCLAPRGRAAQMNAGAQGARADVLLFLHADTQLPPDAGIAISRALAGGKVWGRFDVRIDGSHPVLRLVAHLMNWRSRMTGVATGDQAMFVRRTVFESIGGFAALPLMEDIELSKRLRAVSPPVCLTAQVVTSGRRWEKQGVWRTIVHMWCLRLAYWIGVAPPLLARWYGYAPQPETTAPAAVAILAKAPVPGLAKTRLAPLLGLPGAARAQRRFAWRSWLAASAAAIGPVTIWCAPDSKHRFFRALARTGQVHCDNQCAGDLGMRMQQICTQHFSRQADLPLLLIGTDCPVMGPGHLRAAALALTRHEVVLIPADDGGYVLIGMRRPVPQMFEAIDWSTPQVLQQTRERLVAAGTSCIELPALWDVDEPGDWQRLERLFGR